MTIKIYKPSKSSMQSGLAKTKLWVAEYIPEKDSSYVSHYFDLLVDSEIDYKIICEHDPAPQKDGVFADKQTKLCEDLEDGGKTTFDIYEDEADYPGEVC